jgi:hypothetical protein
MSDFVSAGAEVSIAPDEAFALFTSGFGSWWPREFSWSQDVLEEIGMETVPSTAASSATVGSAPATPR